MIIHLSEMMKEKGSIREIKVPLDLTMFSINGAEYAFAKKDPVKLIFSYLGERKLIIEFYTSVTLTVPCSRCLKDVSVPFSLQDKKELNLNETDEDRVNELDETNYIEGYNLDVDLMIYNEILLNFPLKVLCDDNCKGICPICGKNRNIEECNCKEETIDPRMALIQDIFNQNKEV